MPPDDEPAALTIRLPKDLYEWFRRDAFERRLSMNSMIIEMLNELRKQEGE